MSSTATVRPATLDDADAIAAVHVETWRETYTGLMPDEMFDDTALERRRGAWAFMLGADAPPLTIVVAERDARIVGFALAGASKGADATKGFEPTRDLTLFAIYLLASEHGTGVGHALLTGAIADRPAQLWVASANQRARAFYERHGFREDGVSFEDVHIGGIVELRMVR